jgi:hypothetical protein
MPPDNLHMTVLEITHSRQEYEISERIAQLQPCLQEITDYTLRHRCKLVKPMLSFDASAMALSFVPAASSQEEEHNYTYHHLRRDIYGICTDAGVEVDSRYVLPSAHLTIARFVNTEDTAKKLEDTTVPDHTKIEALIEAIEAINNWLHEEHWSDAQRENGSCVWWVGQEKGLDCQRGTLWYGNGNRVRIGEGF